MSRLLATRRTILASCLALAVLSGCYDWRQGVIDTASVAHSCPADRIRILADAGPGGARTVRLDVCDEERVYQQFGSAGSYRWVEAPSSGGEAP